MTDWKFGARSELELKTCELELVNIMRVSLSFSDVDFGIMQGARTIDQQRQYFKAGNSQVDPDAYPDKHKLYKAAKHITGPGMPLSRACDVVVAFKGKSYDPQTLCYIAGVVLTVAKSLEIPLRWGGNWNEDGQIVTGQKFVDLPHFELM